MTHCRVCVLVALLLGAPAPGRTQQAGRTAVAADFAQWSVRLTTAVGAAGQQTVTVYPGSFTVVGMTAESAVTRNTPLVVDTGSREETVTPIWTNCNNSDVGPCSFLATFQFPHAAGARVQSATGGLQEAVNYESAAGGGTVEVDGRSGTGPLPPLSGSGDVALADIRGGDFSLYRWSGSAYVPVISESAQGVSVSDLAAQSDEGVVNADRFCSGAGVYDDTCLTGALAAVGSAGGVVRVPGPHQYAIRSDLTVPANVDLAIGDGAGLQINAGVTLTLAGPLSAGPYPIFSGPGAVRFAANSPLRRADVRWWGAVCDGAHDDTAALQAALNAAGSVPLYISPGGNCVASAALAYRSGLDLEGGGGRNVRSLLSWRLTAPAATTTALLGPGPGQDAANLVLGHVMLNASQVVAASASANIVLLDAPNADQATLREVQFYGPVANANGWSGGFVYGLYVHSLAGGNSFYGSLLNSTFSQLTNDEVLLGQAGNQVNAWHHIGDIYFDAAAAGQSTGVNVDAAFAASDSWSDCTFSNGSGAFVLHGTSVAGFDIVNSYIDGGLQGAFLAAPDLPPATPAANIAYFAGDTGLTRAAISLPPASFTYFGPDASVLAAVTTTLAGTAGTAVCSESLQGQLKVATCSLTAYAEQAVAQQFALPVAFSAAPVLLEGGGSCGAFHPSATAGAITLPAGGAMSPETCDIVALGQ
jgi:hypothetical protein